MNSIEGVKNITLGFLGEYKTKFKKLEMKQKNDVGDLSFILSDLISYGKNADTLPINYRDKDYSFLLKLDNNERDRLTLAYTLYMYSIFLIELDKTIKNREFIFDIIFSLGDDGKHREPILYPNYHYNIGNKKEGKIGRIEWHSGIDFTKKTSKGEKYFKKMISDLGLRKYFEVTSFYFDYGGWGEYNLVLDYKLKDIKNKKNTCDEYKKIRSKLLK